MTGFMRTGYCEVPPEDYGNHSVAGEDRPSLGKIAAYRAGTDQADFV
jgi:hypothetical protein